MKTNSKKGFTIIEVVLVLAIAGLIFLMVFIALPNMQRSQRDTARRNDYAAFSANITSYISNNNGKLPQAKAKLIPNRYINEDGKDTSGLRYCIEVKSLAKDALFTAMEPLNRNNENDCTSDGSAVTGSEGIVMVYLVTGAECEGTDPTNGTTVPKGTGHARAFSVYAQLETGTYCQSNN